MRKERDDLALETRRSLFELVMEYPGLHFREIVRRSEMSSSNVDYHLRYLIKHEVLVMVEDGRLKRFYVRGKVSRDDKRILAVLRKEIPRGIVLFFLMEPETTIQDMEEVFDLTRSQTIYYMKKLVEKDLLVQEETSNGPTYRVKNEEQVASVLIAFRPTFMDVLVDSFADAWLGRTQQIKKKR